MEHADPKAYTQLSNDVMYATMCVCARERESRYLKSLEKPSSATLLAVNKMLEKEKYMRKRKTKLEK